MKYVNISIHIDFHGTSFILHEPIPTDLYNNSLVYVAWVCSNELFQNNTPCRLLNWGQFDEICLKNYGIFNMHWRVVGNEWFIQCINLSARGSAVKHSYSICNDCYNLPSRNGRRISVHIDCSFFLSIKVENSLLYLTDTFTIQEM